MMLPASHRPPMPEPEDDPLPDDRIPPEDDTPAPHPDPVVYRYVNLTQCMLDQWDGNKVEAYLRASSIAASSVSKTRLSPMRCFSM